MRLGSTRDLSGGFAVGYGTLLAFSAACLVMLAVFRPGRTIDDARSHRPLRPGAERRLSDALDP